MKHGRKIAHIAGGVLYGLTIGAAAAADLNVAKVPLFLPGVVPPLNMLVMSRDHRMFYEAYNDASDLNGDGVIDTGYKPAQIDYFGYFDSHRCYTYGSGVFAPTSAATNKTCAGADEWSGDWLNYMTMSRIDAMRKVLYGGLRSTDTATETVLQRAYIPQDAHSWGKEYTSTAVDGYDISLYTPLSQPSDANRRHLFANTTLSGDPAVSLAANPAINGVAVPKFRVLENRRGNRIWEWVSKERPVAGSTMDNSRFGTDCGTNQAIADWGVRSSLNGCNTSSSGKGTLTDYVVRVQVCAAGTYDEAASDCRVYGSGGPGSNAKPVGLLQDYGENDRMLFGLMTGSYGKPHDGGVLRKAVASLKDEIDLTTGQIKILSPAGIINTIDRLRITSFNGDQYACGWIATSSDAAGNCSMWGNPIAEMMFETVRYFAGKTASTGEFSTGANSAEETGIGLSVAAWNSATNPYNSAALSCAKPFQTVISDTSPSYDSDKVPGNPFSASSGDVSGFNATTLGNKIWNDEIGGSAPYFIGQSGATYDGAPTEKTVSSFANIRGLSPEAPAKEGSYNAASVAHFGLTTDLNAAPNAQKLQTFAVALASPLPKIEIRANGQLMTLVPFAKSVGWPGNTPGISATQGQYQPTNQIVDFYVEEWTPTFGRFRVNFEDVEQGADHDMDAIASYEYEVTAGGSVKITVKSEYAAGGIIQHLGYVISGTDGADGTYLVVRDRDTAAANDVNYFLDSPNDAAALPFDSTKTFEFGNDAAAGLLNDPLWYAAKWGGFVDANKNDLPDVQSEWDANNDDTPDNYFLVTNALTLRAKLESAFDLVEERNRSASAVATNTTRLDTNTLIFQAQFQSSDWTGNLLAYRLNDKTGAIQSLAWDAAEELPAHNLRKIFTRASAIPGPGAGDGKPFLWNDLGTTHQTALNRRPDGTPDPVGSERGADRVAWLRGDQAQEGIGAGKFRVRSVPLGDIINSDPQFVGAQDFGYESLPVGTPGRGDYQTFRETKIQVDPINDTVTVVHPTVYVGANDGMLHAFDATTGIERFAYVPSTLIPELNQLADPGYSHRYFVDGQSAVGDAFINRGGVEQWATVLVGTTGAGGKTVFALDVTRPHDFKTTDVMWEFTDPDLGDTIGQPTVARMADGTWVAVFGNGYNSVNQHAMLYIVRLADGTLLKKIDTGVGTLAAPNGLATPSLLADATRTIRTVYAGDLAGNLWKFDVSDADPDNWGVAFTSAGVPAPLFKATDSTGAAQPITAPAEIGRHPNGGFMIYFGTGKFFETGDNIVTSPAPVQSFYGVWDKPAPTAIAYGADRQTVLTRQTILYEGKPDNSNFNVRVTSQNAVDWTAARGWYIDLQHPNSAIGGRGERVVSLPILRHGRVIFPTLIPSANPCEFGGSSWLMEITAVTGARLELPPLDIDEDGDIDADDRVTVEIGGVTVTVPPSAVEAREGIIDTPAVVDTGDGREVKLASGTSGNVEMLRERGSGERARGSWRQLR